MIELNGELYNTTKLRTVNKLVEHVPMENRNNYDKVYSLELDFAGSSLFDRGYVVKATFKSKEERDKKYNEIRSK